MKTWCLSAVTWAFFASGAPAQSLIGSVGYLHFGSEYGIDTPVFELEYAAAPHWTLFSFDIGWSALGRYDAEDGFFLGFGFLGTRRFREDWFVELGFMPGYYRENRPENNLGNEIEFRSMIGLGRNLSDAFAVSLGLSHMSNGGLDDLNPGADALHLRLHYKF